MRKTNLDKCNLEELSKVYQGNFKITEDVLKTYNKIYTGSEYDSCKKKNQLIHNRRMKFLNIIKHKRFNEVPATSIKEGFIYVASNPAFPARYKIGRTLEPYDRLNSFNILCPDKNWKLECWYASKDMRKAESSLLRLLSSDNCQGEWTGRKLDIVKSVIKNHHLIDNWENLPDDIKFSIY